ncbi:hypothetical protein [uncultured Tateyamaria sp.]|uniref:hypothetical protein n=1 Tax=uncultured Tateyamaria sp. TaxID=455651 RepID=UPI0026083251|nr:hypothetical protein [uncultured Tateyamaria sp.]
MNDVKISSQVPGASSSAAPAETDQVAKEFAVAARAAQAQPTEEIEPAEEIEEVRATDSTQGVFRRKRKRLAEMRTQFQATQAELREVRQFVTTIRAGEDKVLPRSIAAAVDGALLKLKHAVSNAKHVGRLNQALVIAHPLIAVNESALFSGQFKVAPIHLVFLYKFDEPKDLTILPLIRHETSLGLGKFPGGGDTGFTGGIGGFIADEFGPAVVLSIDRIPRPVQTTGTDEENPAAEPARSSATTAIEMQQRADANERISDTDITLATEAKTAQSVEFELGEDRKVHVKSKTFIKQVHRGFAITLGGSFGPNETNVSTKPMGLESFSTRSFDIFDKDTADTNRRKAVLNGLAVEKLVGMGAASAAHFAAQALPFAPAAQNSGTGMLVALGVAELSTTLAGLVGTGASLAVRTVVDSLVKPDGRGFVVLPTADPVIVNTPRVELASFGGNKKATFGGFGIVKLQYRLPLYTGLNNPKENTNIARINRDLDTAVKNLETLRELEQNLTTDKNEVLTQRKAMEEINLKLGESHQELDKLSDDLLDAVGLMQNDIAQIDASKSLISESKAHLQVLEEELPKFEQGSDDHSEIERQIAQEKETIETEEARVGDGTEYKDLSDKLDAATVMLHGGQPEENSVGILIVAKQVKDALTDSQNLLDSLTQLETEQKETVETKTNELRQRVTGLARQKTALDEKAARMKAYSQPRQERFDGIAERHNQEVVDKQSEIFATDMANKLKIKRD